MIQSNQRDMILWYFLNLPGGDTPAVLQFRTQQVPKSANMSWCDDIYCSPSLHCTGHVVCPFFRPSLVLFLCASQKKRRKEGSKDRQRAKQKAIRSKEGGTTKEHTRGRFTSSLMQGAAQAYPSVLSPLYPVSCSRFNLPWCSAVHATSTVTGAR